MDNAEKQRVLQQWINPEERVTVDFEDEQALNAEVTACSLELVDLLLDTSVPFRRQRLSLPLSLVDLQEDRTRYTRDPDEPLRSSRLRLVVHQPRPAMV